MTLTIQEFKDYFIRDFDYNAYSAWSVSTPYIVNNEVYDISNYLVYKCLADNTGLQPKNNPPQWQNLNIDVKNFILDTDIQKAIDPALASSPYVIENCIPDINIQKKAYLLLSAHYLYIQSSNLSGSISQGFITSASAEGLSRSFQIPNFFNNDESKFYYSQSKYGLEYMQLVEFYKGLGYMDIVLQDSSLFRS